VSARLDTGRSWIAFALLSLLGIAASAPPAQAETLGDLYSVSVPYTGENEAAFRQAMRDVLVRVTGRGDAPELENLAPLVAQASRYVKSFRRAPGNMLAVTFDGTAIEDAVDASGLAFWDHERPVTLVWPDAGDDLVRAMQQAWSGDHAALRDAARRYGADGVLIGRARQAAGGYQVEWSFASAGADGGATGDLEAGPALAAERYAGVYASRGAAQRTEQIVTVTGIASLESYAATLRALAKLAPVRGVAVDEVTPDGVSFRVNVRGDPGALDQAIQRDGRLYAVDAGRLIYALAP
jgi:hypothetical protein